MISQNWNPKAVQNQGPTTFYALWNTTIIHKESDKGIQPGFQLTKLKDKIGGDPLLQTEQPISAPRPSGY